jgi:hypothetical protein
MLFNYSFAEVLLERILELLSKTTLSPSMIERLRKEFPICSENILRQAIDIATGTIHARQSGKFSEQYSEWLFTRQTFEQSTSDRIAAHHAMRFSSSNSVLEVCTGAGIDTAALSSQCNAITSIEANSEIASIARRNFLHLGIKNITILEGKAEDVAPLILDSTTFDGLWADPSRRKSDGTRKSMSAHEYEPDLEWIMNLPIQGTKGIKVSPALSMENLPEGWVREWIGYKHECREQILWKNTAITDGTVSLVDRQVSWSPKKTGISPFDIVVPLKEVQYIVEPHPCLIRSGYLAEFFQTCTIGLFDHRIGYGISTKLLQSTPFFSSFEIIDYFNFNYKLLQKRITQLNWNKETEIKKRGFPELPDEVRKKLRFAINSNECGVILLSQQDKQKIVFLARRIRNDEQ